MTTALAFDLFLDEQLLDDNTITTYDITMLSVVGDENSEIDFKNYKPENENRENEILNFKGKNDNSEIKMLKSKGSFLGNQNLFGQSRYSENEKREIKKDLMKGYMRLLSN